MSDSSNIITNVAGVVGTVTAAAAVKGIVTQARGAHEEAVNTGATGSAVRDLRNSNRQARDDLDKNATADKVQKAELTEAIEKGAQTLDAQTKREKVNTDEDSKVHAAVHYVGDVALGMASENTVQKEAEALSQEGDKAADRLVHNNKSSRV